MSKNNDEHVDDKYVIRIARTIEDVEKISDAWRELTKRKREATPDLEVPNSDIHHYIAVIKNMKQVERPHVISLLKGDRTVAMLVGRIESLRLACNIGYKTVFKPRARCLSIIYGGVFLDVTDRIARSLLLKEIMATIRSGEIDMVSFHMLPSGSIFTQEIRKLSTPFLRDHFPEKQPHWKMSLPHTMEEFYASKSKGHRKNLRYYTRRLEKDYTGRIEIHCFTEEGEVHHTMSDIETIANKTYLRGMGVGFQNDALTRERMTVAAQQGWLRSHILYIEKKPCAFQLGFHYGNRYCDKGKGYVPEFYSYRIGTYLFLKILEELCNDENIEEWDFGFGDAEYKRHYSNTSWSEETIHIFAPTLTGLKLSVLWTIAGSISLLAAKILDNINLVAGIKKRWRQLLIPKQEHAPKGK